MLTLINEVKVRWKLRLQSCLAGAEACVSYWTLRVVFLA
jgi:hypothetical protein